MKDVLRIANGQGFWGDDGDAPARLLAQDPGLDFLTLDYLAEVSMSILAVRRERDANAGYAPDFVDVVRSLVPAWRGGSRVRVVTNAGGLSPYACARACAETLRRSGAPQMRIGVVSGDDVLSLLRAPAGAAARPNADDRCHWQLAASALDSRPTEHLNGPSGLRSVQNHQDLGSPRHWQQAASGTDGDPAQTSSDFRNLETAEPIDVVRDSLVTANAYLGAAGIVEALQAGCRIVITGRVADPSLTVGPCFAHFGWAWDQWDAIAGATIAGHLIECGVQVTGGIATDWLDTPDPAHLGFPIAEVDATGACVITKPKATGGRVSVETVKEQLLYEIGDPDHYLSPEVELSMLWLRVTQEAPDRVRVEGAVGRPAPGAYKVSATYRAGFRAQGFLTIFGRDAAAKARRCAEMVLTRLRDAGCRPEQWRAECLGSGAVISGDSGAACGTKRVGTGAQEVVLRLAVADPRKDVVERFTREVMPLITAGPQGVTGYAEGRPRVHPVFGYWPCLIDRRLVAPRVEVIET